MWRSARRRWVREYQEGLTLGGSRISAALVATSVLTGGLLGVLLAGIVLVVVLYCIFVLWGTQTPRAAADVAAIGVATVIHGTATADFAPGPGGRLSAQTA